MIVEILPRTKEEEVEVEEEDKIIISGTLGSIADLLTSSFLDTGTPSYLTHLSINLFFFQIFLWIKG